MSGIQIKSTGNCADRTLPMLNPLFTPSLLSRPVESWDCGAGITADGSGNVSEWKGTIGGRVMTGAGDSRPTNTFDMNGHGALRFVATKQLDFTNFWGDAVSEPLMYWAVLDVQSYPSGVAQKLFDIVTFSPDLNVGASNNFRPSSGTTETPGTAFMPGKVLIVLYGDPADGASKVRVNGALVKSVAGLAAVTFAISGPGCVGRYRGTPNSFLVDTAMAALGFAKGTQSLLSIQKLEGYLAQRFMPANFLPAGHPYRTVAPRKLG